MLLAGMNEYRKFTETEEKWIKSFQRMMKKAPDTLFMFVGNGIVIYPLDESGDRYMNDAGGVDDSAPCESIFTAIRNDGGDY